MIRHAVLLQLPFSLSFRDVEELLAQQGIEVSYETIRCWTIKFGPFFARRISREIQLLKPVKTVVGIVGPVAICVLDPVGLAVIGPSLNAGVLAPGGRGWTVF